MPIKEICPNTGAIIYTRTPEEQRMADMEKELNDLKSQLAKLSNQQTKKK